LSLEGDNVTASVLRTGRVARIDSYDGARGALAAHLRQLGFRSAIGGPIAVQGRLWGAMVADWVGPEPFPASTDDRLAQFTELVATAIANAESRAELAASRARVVAAADETRRRLERDLHDGTQQRLVSLALDLRAAEASVPSELTDLRLQLAEMAKGLAGAVDDLREISRGLHPAILSQGGLAPALRTLARRSAVPVQLEVRAERRLPEPVEVAAYYVVSEALTNAAKHARASVVRVEVDADGVFLRVSVHDDGAGGADPARGSGLVGLKDRVESLGGTIEIASPVGGGTALLVRVPVKNPVLSTHS
jgi:signal transduction histidine kinase